MKVKQVVVVTKLFPSALRAPTKKVHRQTLKATLDLLKKHKILYRVIDRSLLKAPLKADLIITVGGDGTALAASHFAGLTPLFGINSAPQTSTGFFCMANPQNLAAHFKAILKGKRKPVLVPRLKVAINGVELPYPVLNELLFASKLQGETARYKIKIGKMTEEQKSSGVWVATGAGSTAAIYSAGGKKDFPYSKKLQYLVREPLRFPKTHYHLLKGFIKPGQKISLICEMNQGMIFMDGGKLHFSVPKNAVITVRGGLSPLKIFL